MRPLFVVSFAVAASAFPSEFCRTFLGRSSVPNVPTSTEYFTLHWTGHKEWCSTPVQTVTPPPVTTTTVQTSTTTLVITAPQNTDTITTTLTGESRYLMFRSHPWLTESRHRDRHNNHYDNVDYFDGDDDYLYLHIDGANSRRLHPNIRRARLRTQEEEISCRSPRTTSKSGCYQTLHRGRQSGVFAISVSYCG